MVVFIGTLRNHRIYMYLFGGCYIPGRGKGLIFGRLFANEIWWGGGGFFGGGAYYWNFTVA